LEACNVKTALLIHSYPGAADIVRRHWPYYKNSGMEMFGVGRTDGDCVWPETVPTKNLGLNSYINGDNLPRRLVDTFRWFLDDPVFQSFTHAVIAEYDLIWLRPLPVIPAVGAHRAGPNIPPMRSNNFYHCPWILDREHAKMFVAKGDELLAKGDFELGNPDFMFGLIWQELGVMVEHLEGTFSRNSLDLAPDRIMARDRIRAGELWAVHGVKTAGQLAEILS
jgi:hypothetical protein